MSSRKKFWIEGSENGEIFDACADSSEQRPYVGGRSEADLGSILFALMEVAIKHKTL